MTKHDPGKLEEKQLNHFFNYEAWNQQMNQRKPKKAKPNPKKKRKKVFKM